MLLLGCCAGAFGNVYIGLHRSLLPIASLREPQKNTCEIRMGGASGAKAYGAVVLIRVMYSGMHIMSKIALDQGMNPFVFVFYRHTTAALVLIPVAFALER